MGYGSPGLDGNSYNRPLNHDGSDFPCKGQIGKADMTPQATWTSGSKGMFEIWPNEGNGAEGNMAGHSGGSCQASLSFDNGKNWKAIHSYHGGCPRDVPFGSNIGGPNQTFTFDIPNETKSGKALFAWTWLARTGNRGEFYMNCASVEIQGSGKSTLDNYPDMYVGDLATGDIGGKMCLSSGGTNLAYPFPGEKVTRAGDGEFKGPKGPGPNGGFEVCRAPGSTGPGGPGTPGDGRSDAGEGDAQSEETPTDEPSLPEKDKTTPPADKPIPSKEEVPNSTGSPIENFEATIQGHVYECRRVQT